MKTSFVPAYQLSADSIRLRPDNTASNFVLYALFALMVLIVTLTGLISTQHSRYTDDIYRFSQYLTAAVVLILALQVRTQVGHLAEIAKVLRSQQVPLRIWNDNVVGILAELFKHTSIASAILATAFLFPYSPWSFAIPAVLITATNSVVLLLCLLHYGLIARSKSPWISGAIFIVLITLSFDGRISLLMSELNQLPTITIVLLALIWPLSLIALCRHLKMRIPASRKVLSVKLWQGLKEYLHRYSFIETMMNESYKRGTVSLTSSLISGAIQLGIFFPHIFTEVKATYKTPSDLFIYLIISLVFTSYLSVKDVHWRYFLLPGRIKQRKLANKMLLSSMQMQGALLLACGSVYQVVSLLYDKNSFFTFIHSLPDYWPFPFEWLFVNVLAIYLASLNKPAPIGKLRLLLTVLGICVIFYFGFIHRNTRLFDVGPIYAACLLFLSYLLMRMNNQRWNGELLLMRVQGK